MEEISLKFSVFCLVLFLSLVVSRRFKVPVVPLFMLSGFLVSFLFENKEGIEVIKFTGITLLLFFIGLEFSLRELEKKFLKVLSVGAVDFIVNFFPIFLILKFFNFKTFDAFIIASALYPSSSAVISRLIVEYRKLANPEIEPVLSILVFEDIVAVILLAVSLSFGGEGTSLQMSAVKVLGFIFLSFLVLKFFSPTVSKILELGKGSKEFVIIFVSFVLFLFVGTSTHFGLSESLGAFIAGMLFAETEFKREVEEVLVPFRDLFGALFFLSFGFSVELAGFDGKKFAFLFVIFVVAVLLKFLSGIAGAKIYGLGLKRGISSGFMLVPRGEFTLLLSSAISYLSFPASFWVFLSCLIGAILTKEGGKLLWRKKKNVFRSRRTLVST